MDDYIWLNEAASAFPKAPGVGEAVLAALGAFPACTERAAGGDDPVRRALGSVLEECRARLAALLAVDAGEIVLAPGATAALNIALWGVGVRLPRGAGVITSVCEHNAVLRPLHHLRKWRPDLRLTHVGLRDGALDTAAFMRALPGAGLVALTHASNVTGRLLDVAPLLAAARAVGAVTVLDAAQSLGHVPVHPRALGADIVAFPGHKGLRGPIGTGGLYLRAGVAIEPLLVGGTGKFSDAYFQPAALPPRLESGTPNIPAFAGLAAALRWAETEGEACRARGEARARALRAGLRRLPGVTLLDDDPGARYTPVVSLRLARCGVEETGQRLAEHFHIIGRTGLQCAPLLHRALGTAPDGTVRLSCSGFTTEADIACALAAIAALA